MTRITHAPGGASSISITDGSSNGTAVAKKPNPVEISSAEGAKPVAQTTAQAPQAVDAAPGIEELKLKVIKALSSNLQDSEETVSFLAEVLQKLQQVKAKDVPAADADESLERLRAALKSRGTHGIISLGRKFKSMDDDNSGQLSFEEWRKAMQEMNLSESDMHRLFRYFDADCSGYLSYEELLVGLRGHLNPRRLDMVQRAFKVLDKTGDGRVSMDDLAGRYDASKHPDVVLGTKTPQQVLEEFMSVFEAQGGGTRGDGVVTLEEFKKYYACLSASIDLDDYFELVIRNAWHISGGEGWCANTTCKRVLVLHEDGAQTVQEIQNDFDVKPEEYLQKLKEQGVQNIKSIALYGEPSDVAPSTGKPAALKPAELTPGSPTPSTPGRANGGQTPDAAYRGNKRAAMTSSITFG